MELELRRCCAVVRHTLGHNHNHSGLRPTLFAHPHLPSPFLHTGSTSAIKNHQSEYPKRPKSATKMSTPRAKRPFAGAAADPSQRQITTFFTSTRPTAAASAPQKHSQYPVLPSAIQSDLLSVGMRVRKSVPEGYKTGSPHSAFRLWDERGGSMRPRRGGAGAGELVPFCGVHRIGGYAVQPAKDDDIEDEDEDEMPGLTSSQETVESVDFENSRKRSYEEEEEEQEGLEILGARVVAGNGGNRIIAIPKGRRKGVAGGGQENVTVNDFEEAAFLDSRVFGDFAMSDA